jgi:pheromone shutdown protein TraB
MADTQQAPVKPFGPVAAVFVAAGIGAVILGILTTLAEASTGIKDTLQLNDRVGPLAGKTIGAVIVFFIAWGLLHMMWKEKDPDSKKVFLWTWIMLAVGVLLTFPIFFQMFEA